MLVALRILISFAWFRRWAGGYLRRWWARVVARLDPPTEEDELAEEMWLVVRGDRLRADVRRVERLLVVDATMPATRQMGNRIAYEWLLRELDRYRGEVADRLPEAWNLAGDAPVTRSLGAPSTHRPAVPQVEVLEIGRRR